MSVRDNCEEKDFAWTKKASHTSHTFPAAEHHRSLAGTKLYFLVTNKVAMYINEQIDKQKIKYKQKKKQ